MLEQYLIKYKSQGILLDTNLLVLYLVGSYKVDLIPDFKRTTMYTIEDFEEINKYIQMFNKIITTPQVLAETWNFVEKLNQSDFIYFIKNVIPQLHSFDEEYIDKKTIIDDDAFSYVGITDLSVIHAAKSLECLVLTDDLRAYSSFLSNSIDALNINHFRSFD